MGDDTPAFIEHLERDGWPTEFRSSSGNCCERLRAMRDRWRANEDQRRDILAAVAAEDGRYEDVDAAIDQCEREIWWWRDCAAWGDPSADGRLIALRVRRGYLLSLKDRQPPCP